MTDYSKFTVVQLKEKVKAHGVPLTGLTRKAQLIDKLQELDTQAEAATIEEQPTATDDAEKSEEQIIEQEAKIIAGEEKPPEEAAAEEAAKDANQVDDAEPTTQRDPIIATTADRTESELEASQDEVNKTTIDTATENGSLAAEAQPDAASEVTKKTTEEDAALPPPEVYPSSKSGDVTIPQDVAQPRDASVASSKLSSPAPEESRKRKERSETPPIDAEEVVRKRQKQENDDTLPSVLLEEDIKTKTSQTSPDEPMQDAAPAGANSKVEENENEQKLKAMEADTLTQASANDAQDLEVKVAQEETSKSQSTKDQRYKGLFSSNTQESQQNDVAPEADAEDDENRAISAAIHPATTALYIRDIMRPLHPGQFKDHLISLAQPPSSETEHVPESDSPLINFHLDSIRTHCFAVFNAVSTAARVRAALHDRVWPVERTRKPLWIDFVPEDKVRQWIDTENDSISGGPRSAKRWEVIYDNAEDGAVVATLQEAGAPTNAPRHIPVSAPDSASGSVRLPPTPDIRRESSSTMAVTNGTGPSQGAGQSASFVALDQLFHSTSVKPKLYYQPVKKGLAEKRLDELDVRTSRRNLIPPGGSGYPDSRRYTFEDDDYLVDNGPEFGLRREGGPGPRGRGGFRGGWRGR